MVFAVCMLSKDGQICMNFHEDTCILNSFKLHSGYESVTDRRTDKHTHVSVKFRPWPWELEDKFFVHDISLCYSK